MANNYTTTSLEALKYLCSVINKLANVSEGIDDLNLRTDGTFSSVKIDTLLNTLKTDCNEYTDRLVANLSRLELKIATSESEITQPNTMYLYKPSGSTSYEQYVVIEGTKVLLGTTDINMGDYYTITQADAKFVLKTDFDALKTKLTTHTDDADIHITSVERTKWDKVDNKIDKTSLLTAISASPSDNNLLSEKAIKSELDKKSNNTDLDNLSQGILVSETSSMNENILLWDVGHYYFNSNDTWKKYKYMPSTEYAPHVYVTSVKPTKYKDINLNSAEKQTWFRQIKVDGHLGKSFIRTIYTPDINDVINLENGKLLPSGSDTGWQRICTTSVEDTSGTVTLPDGVTGTISYKVINGTCYVSVQRLADGLTGLEVVTFTGLPKADVFISISIENSGNHAGTIYSTDGVTFHVHKIVAGEGYGSFSYPVAES